MKALFFLVLICVICSSASAVDHHARAYKCSYESKRRQTAGDLEIQMEGGEIRFLSYGNFTSGRPGTPGYKCDLVVGHANPEQKWTEPIIAGREEKWTNAGKVTSVEIRDLYISGRDVIAITRGPAGFMVDMHDAGHVTLCGAGSSLPESVYLAFKSKTCKVTFRKD
jgi:hypothetical protein